MAHDVVLIPGDGIGPEITQAMRRVVDATGVEIAWQVVDAGAGVMKEYGTPLPRHVLDAVAKTGVAIKGPVTTPVGTGFRSVNVALRQAFDLYACVRPCVTLPGATSRYQDIDLVIVRENTEDLYAGIEFEPGSFEADRLARLLERNGGRSFRPVYGYKEYNGNDNAAESFFMMHTDDYLYVAAFNYTENREVGEIPLDLLDIAAGEFSEVRELWTNEVVDVTDDALPYDVPYEDVRVYRFTKGSGSGIDGVEDEAVAGLKVVALGDGRLMAYAGKDMARIEAYDLQGRLLQAEDLDRRTQVAFSLPQDKGMVLVQVRYADGSKDVCKALVR